MGKKTFLTTLDDAAQATAIANLEAKLAPFLTIASSGVTQLITRVSSLSNAAGI